MKKFSQKEVEKMIKKFSLEADECYAEEEPEDALECLKSCYYWIGYYEARFGNYWKS